MSEEQVETPDTWREGMLSAVDLVRRHIKDCARGGCRFLEVGNGGAAARMSWAMTNCQVLLGDLETQVVRRDRELVERALEVGAEGAGKVSPGGDEDE